MRFMMIVKANKDSEQGKEPSKEMLEAMGAYNTELVKAGVLLDGAGLRPSSEGARVKIAGAKRTVTDGPFTETKELIAGFWILQVRSKEEAIEWAKRCPNPHSELEESELELRRLFEPTDFANAPKELVDAELAFRAGKK